MNNKLDHVHSKIQAENNCVYFCIIKHNFLYNAMFIIIKTYVDTSGFLR